MIGLCLGGFAPTASRDVLDDLIIGAYPLDGEDVAMLEWLGVQRVLNLAEDSEYQDDEREAVEQAYARSKIQEYRMSMTDFGGLPPVLLETATRRGERVA